MFFTIIFVKPQTIYRPLKDDSQFTNQGLTKFQCWKKWTIQPRRDLEETAKQQVTLGMTHQSKWHLIPFLGKRAETYEVTFIAQDLCKVAFLALQPNSRFLHLGKMHGSSERCIFHQKKHSQHFQKQTYEDNEARTKEAGAQVCIGLGDHAPLTTPPPPGGRRQSS